LRPARLDPSSRTVDGNQHRGSCPFWQGTRCESAVVCAPISARGVPFEQSLTSTPPRGSPRCSRTRVARRERLLCSFQQLFLRPGGSRSPRCLHALSTWAYRCRTPARQPYPVPARSPASAARVAAPQPRTRPDLGRPRRTLPAARDAARPVDPPSQPRLRSPKEPWPRGGPRMGATAGPACPQQAPRSRACPCPPVHASRRASERPSPPHQHPPLLRERRPHHSQK